MHRQTNHPVLYVGRAKIVSLISMYVVTTTLTSCICPLSLAWLGFAHTAVAHTSSDTIFHKRPRSSACKMACMHVVCRQPGCNMRRVKHKSETSPGKYLRTYVCSTTKMHQQQQPPRHNSCDQGLFPSITVTPKSSLFLENIIRRGGQCISMFILLCSLRRSYKQWFVPCR